MAKELIQKPKDKKTHKIVQSPTIQPQRPFNPPPIHPQMPIANVNKAAKSSWGSILDNRDKVANQAMREDKTSFGNIIQTKLTVGPVGDKYEQEADAVAQQVVNNLAQQPTAQRQEEDEDVAQMKPVVQREEDDEMQMKPMSPISSLQRAEDEDIQAKGDPMVAGGELSSGVETAVQSAKSGGAPLADPVRQPMEQAFQTDFSGVKVHTDGTANSLNRSLNARAFTTGQDIFFRQGEYQPDNQTGQTLLAHELTHVVQQQGSRQPGAIQRKSKYDKALQIMEMLEPFRPNSGFQAGMPDKFVFTVGVARGGEDYVSFAKKRMKSTIRNKARSALRKGPGLKKFFRKSKSSAEIKKRSAEKVLSSKGVEQPGQTQIDRIINESADVGHTWVKLTLYEDGDAMGTYSFGFIPGDAPQHPTMPVTGVVRNPDIEYETESNTRFIDTPLSQSDFRNGLKKITKLHDSPPNYTTSGYNCTKFAREVAKAAGATFPGGTGMMIPISDLGLFQKAYNPGKLYEKLGGKDDVYTESPEREALESGSEMNDEGQIVSPEQAAADREANWTEDDVERALYRNRYVIHDQDAEQIRQQTGLTKTLLEKLSADKIREMCRDDMVEELGVVYDKLGATPPGGIEFYLWQPPAYERRFKSDEWRVRGLGGRGGGFY